MTRINVIPAEELWDQHLLAEHREIKRIPNCIKKWKYNMSWIPSEYTMWTWHVKFFYDKLFFLMERYWELYNECRKRWFKVTNYWEAFFDLPSEFMWEYKPTDEAIDINKKRLQEKYKPGFYKYYWVNV